jgi:hypothetical protein
MSPEEKNKALVRRKVISDPPSLGYGVASA